MHWISWVFTCFLQICVCQHKIDCYNNCIKQQQKNTSHFILQSTCYIFLPSFFLPHFCLKSFVVVWKQEVSAGFIYQLVEFTFGWVSNITTFSAVLCKLCNVNGWNKQSDVEWSGENVLSTTFKTFKFQSVASFKFDLVGEKLVFFGERP